MLTSLVARLQSKRASEPSRYAAWSAARLQLRSDGTLGRLPPLGDLQSYLNSVPSDQHSEALQDLVAVHLQLSWQAGRGDKLESYVEQNPSLGATADLPADLIEDELLARYQYPNGDFPAIGGYQKRFPSRPQLIERLKSRCLDGGRYVKLRRIGIGAVAVVWEAFDRSACRIVAIKEPLRVFEPSPPTSKPHPFASEVALGRRLNHPGIVGMVEVLPSDGTPPFYVMRLVGRLTLCDKIQQQHEKLAKVSKTAAFQEGLRDLLEAVARVCDAIDYAHKRGILHCDIKPENVACNDHCDIGVIDWGLAVEMRQADKDGGRRSASASHRRLAGTPHYMAPEQMDGIIDVRTEVFGLGAILYEALTAQAPYFWSEGGTEKRPDDWPERIRQARFPYPRKIQRRIPKPLEAICRKAMALDPTDRHQSAAELAKDLRAALGGKSDYPWY